MHKYFNDTCTQSVQIIVNFLQYDYLFGKKKKKKKKKIGCPKFNGFVDIVNSMNVDIVFCFNFLLMYWLFCRITVHSKQRVKDCRKQEMIYSEAPYLTNTEISKCV